MYSKFKIFSVTAAALAVGILLHGCGTEAPNTPLAQDGLKQVSINSTDLFTGDITKVPGYREPDAEEKVVAKTAQAQALIEFDHAYAMVFRCMSTVTGEVISSCAFYTDMFQAFNGRTPVSHWDNLLAGCMALQTKDIVGVTELDKAGDHVEGSVYVRPGINTVLVLFVLDGTVTYTSVNDYINLDGLDMDAEENHALEWMTGGWYDEYWTSNMFSGYDIGSYWFSNYIYLDITQTSVDIACGIPVLMITGGPADGAVVIPGYITWYAQNFTGTVLYTFYLDTVNPPLVSPLVDTPVNSYSPSGLQSGVTYYWQVKATDGTATKTTEVRSFTIP